MWGVIPYMEAVQTVNLVPSGSGGSSPSLPTIFERTPIMLLNGTLNEELLEETIRKCQTSAKKWLKELEEEPMVLRLDIKTPDGQKYQVKATYKVDLVEINQIGGEDVTPKTVH